MPVERILVVDDEETIRDIVSSMLANANYKCRQAASGMEALALLDSGEEFELMLSDLMMANLDGIGLLERTKERFPDMPVVMVTAVHDISIALGAIRNGAYDYLLKPFEREQLLNTVRRALENRRLKLENRKYQTDLEKLVDERTDQLRKAMGNLERSYDITLEALGDALDLKDAETEGHSKRVTAFTMTIARAMELPQDRVRVIARGAFLHDVGKMAIPDAILRKPGRLTPEEQMLMREHALLGYQMLRKIPFLHEAASIVYSHQERYDGSGYPRGLKGEQIPLGARIFAVADTFDAITSDRPYRAAQSISAARREIQKHAGLQFDPSVVETFLSISEDLWQELREKIDGQPTKKR
jgi:putative nucleotidyltransferase with HDIG domain